MQKIQKDVTRCHWVTDDPIYIAYHDSEWGIPVWEDKLLFEFLILEGMQAGLSWITILKKRENYRKQFDNFNVQKIVRYDDQKIQTLLADPGIIRNKLKVQSILTNAHAYLQLKKDGENFSEYLWHFVGGKPIQNHWSKASQIPSKTAISDTMSKDLKKRGFKFIGSTICYAFMQAVGMVCDHTTNCFCYKKNR